MTLFRGPRSSDRAHGLCGVRAQKTQARRAVSEARWAIPEAPAGVLVLDGDVAVRRRGPHQSFQLRGIPAVLCTSPLFIAWTPSSFHAHDVTTALLRRPLLEEVIAGGSRAAM